MRTTHLYTLILTSLIMVMGLATADYGFENPSIPHINPITTSITNVSGANVNNSVYWDGHAFVFGAVSSIEADPLSIHKDGSSVTTAEIPFAEGIFIPANKNINISEGGMIKLTGPVDDLGQIYASSVGGDKLVVQSPFGQLVLHGGAGDGYIPGVIVTDTLRTDQQIMPNVNDVSDIGNDTKRYRGIFTNDLNVKRGANITGNITSAQFIIGNGTYITDVNASYLQGYQVGQSGSKIPLLSTENNWSASQRFTNGFGNYFGSLAAQGNFFQRYDSGGTPATLSFIFTPGTIVSSAVISSNVGLRVNTQSVGTYSGTYSLFGTQPSLVASADTTDVLVVSMVDNSTTAVRRGLVAVGEFAGDQNTNFGYNGINAFVGASATATANMTATTQGGGARNRYVASNQGSGVITQGSAVTAFVTGNTFTQAADYHAESPTVNSGITWQNFSGMWIRGGAISGTINNRYGVKIDALVGGTNLYGIYQEGSSDSNYFAGQTNIANKLNVTGNTQINGNLVVLQNLSVRRPFWNGYDNSTQLFINTANTQVINISNNADFDSYGIRVVGNQNLTFDQTGDYLCTLSPEFFQNSGGAALITFWIQKNGTDVAWSNSRYTVPNNAYNAPSIPFQFKINNPASENVRFMWWSDSTNSQIYSSGALTSPTRPSIPGIILNCQKVSERN